MSNNIKQHWDVNLKTEVDYWKWYAKNKNDTEISLIERANLNREVIALAKPLIKSSDIKALDVGSGPVSYLGYRYNNNLINLTLVDPLADEYKEILTKNNIPNQYIPSKCDGESLDEFFANGEKFDFIYSRNALDHAYDPFKAISNMIGLMSLSEKSSILLEVYHREGEYQNYNGLHQWNFDLTENGDIQISSKDGVTHYLSSLNPNNELKIIVGSYDYCKPRWSEIQTCMIIVFLKGYNTDEIVSYNSFLSSYLLERNIELVKEVKKASPFLEIKPFIKKIINGTYYLLRKMEKELEGNKLYDSLASMVKKLLNNK